MSVLGLFFVALLMRKGNSVCRLKGLAQPPELAQDGDLFLGGIFSFRTDQDFIIDTFQTIPKLRKCIKYAYSYLNECSAFIFGPLTFRHNFLVF